MGQACFEPGEAKNTYGTGCFMLLNTGSRPVQSTKGLLTTLAYQIGTSQSTYALEGSIAITGALVQWMRDNLGLIEKSSDIEPLARSVDYNGGVYFVPAFSGLFAPYWRSDARGVIVGLTRYANKGHLARAVLEATAFQTREVLDAMEQDSGVRLSSLKVDGGLVHNHLLMQFQSDLLGVPVVRPKIAETTALGAAYAAGLAVGFWINFDDLRQNWQVSQTWKPHMAAADRDALYRTWLKAVERRDLAYGTTGRYHGLLHSGARYAVKDPKAAWECYEENQILRCIMPTCIEDTGGIFVLTPFDDPAYVHQFLNGCRNAGIPIEYISIGNMLDEEPLLDPKIQACFRVPDASADSFLAANLNALSACEHGAEVLTYHEVDHLLTTNGSHSGQSTVAVAICHDLIKDEAVQIDANLVVNASGAWAGKIAHTAGINLVMVPGKGTMLALNHRVVNTIISRCRPPSDGDILVPAHTVAVIGTTDVRVADPDHISIEPWEIRLMLDEGEKIIPGFKQYRILRAWAGVRPLVQGADSSDDRDISRAFVLLDHAERDGVEGLLTISGGKWTTSRKMAQVTVDRVCQKLKVDRPCRTHLEELPSHKQESASYPSLGDRLKKIEQNSTYGELICECELASVQDVEQSIIASNAATLDDIRRATRLGMGPCQGAFCTFRAAGLLQSLRHLDANQINMSLRDFLQERWKGNLPVLSGQQLRQARFNEFIYVDVLNTPRLPGGQTSMLAADEYSRPETTDSTLSPTIFSPTATPTPPAQPQPQDVIVVGGGFSGLITAWQAGLMGCKTTVLTQGWGTPYWSSGCIDIIGFHPHDLNEPIASPRGLLEQLVISSPDHPYSMAGLATLENAIQSFKALCETSGYPFLGSLDANILLPTSLGTLRPTCLVPATMTSGDASQRIPMLIVGFDRFYDFFSGLLASNLNAQGILVADITLNLPSLRKQKYITGKMLASMFDDPEFRQEVIDALKPRLGKVARIGFPAVLGLHNPMETLEHLQTSLGLPVFEIPGLPPSVPGIRLQNILVAAIQRNHGAVYTGMRVTNVGNDGKSIHSVWSEAAARQISHRAKTFILATGGILGGGISVTDIDYAQENVFGLPITTPEHRSNWFQANFLAAQGHPIFRTGVTTDAEFRPLDETGGIIYSNLHVVGSSLANCDPVRERSMEGIALASGFRVGEIIAGRS